MAIILVILTEIVLKSSLKTWIVMTMVLMQSIETVVLIQIGITWTMLSREFKPRLKQFWLLTYFLSGLREFGKNLEIQADALLDDVTKYTDCLTSRCYLWNNKIVHSSKNFYSCLSIFLYSNLEMAKFWFFLWFFLWFSLNESLLFFLALGLSSHWAIGKKL